MPLVIIKADRNNLWLTDDYLRQFGLFMLEAVAETLSCKDSKFQLTVHDIEVDIRDQKPADIRNSQYDLMITIIAGEGPELEATRQSKSQDLTAKIRDFLPGDTHGYVWLLVVPDCFTKF
jgi:hypothetical protein